MGIKGRIRSDDASQRRAELLRRRRGGEPFDAIWPDLGYASRSAATKDFHRVMEAHRDEEKAEAALYRQQQGERLDALLAAVWPKAMKGDVRSQEQALKTVQAYTKLYRLDQIPEEGGNQAGIDLLTRMGAALTALAGGAEPHDQDEDEDGG